jgi:hypothetical protein
MKIKLVGCDRFNHTGEMFLKSEGVYNLPDARAKYLLGLTDDQSGFPWFELYTGAEEGKTPSAPASDNTKAPRRERSKLEERRTARQPRVGRAPAQVTETNGIEDGDAVAV